MERVSKWNARVFQEGMGRSARGLTGDQRLDREAAKEDPDGGAHLAIQGDGRQRGQNRVGAHGPKEASEHHTQFLHAGGTATVRAFRIPGCVGFAVLTVFEEMHFPKGLQAD